MLVKVFWLGLWITCSKANMDHLKIFKGTEFKTGPWGTQQDIYLCWNFCLCSGLYKCIFIVDLYKTVALYITTSTWWQTDKIRSVVELLQKSQLCSTLILIMFKNVSTAVSFLMAPLLALTRVLVYKSKCCRCAITVTLTFDHQNLVSSFFSPSGCLQQVWINSLKSVLRYHIQIDYKEASQVIIWLSPHLRLLQH